METGKEIAKFDAPKNSHVCLIPILAGCDSHALENHNINDIKSTVSGTLTSCEVSLSCGTDRSRIRKSQLVNTSTKNLNFDKHLDLNLPQL
ncbi:hypothetical protein L1887_14906 [Cichorium endivia]|nr:hypothetical protein L1887_14906 [Cichorium endivia]